MKTTKSFGKRIDTIVNKLYELQESIEEAILEYDEYEMENDSLTEKQQEKRDELQEEYDEIQNAIDYLDMFTSDNL